MSVWNIKLPCDKKIFWGSAALSGLALAGLVSVFVLLQFTESSQRVSQVLVRLDRVMRYVSDARVANRGYAATGSELLLVPYNTAAVPAQKERLSRLQQMVIDEFNAIRGAIDLKKNQGSRAGQRPEGLRDYAQVE